MFGSCFYRVAKHDFNSSARFSSVHVAHIHLFVQMKWRWQIKALFPCFHNKIRQLKTEMDENWCQKSETKTNAKFNEILRYSFGVFAFDFNSLFVFIISSFRLFDYHKNEIKSYDISVFSDLNEFGGNACDCLYTLLFTDINRIPFQHRMQALFTFIRRLSIFFFPRFWFSSVVAAFYRSISHTDGKIHAHNLCCTSDGKRRYETISFFFRLSSMLDDFNENRLDDVFNGNSASFSRSRSLFLPRQKQENCSNKCKTNWEFHFCN